MFQIPGWLASWLAGRLGAEGSQLCNVLNDLNVSNSCWLAGWLVGWRGSGVSQVSFMALHGAIERHEGTQVSFMALHGAM